MINLLKCNRKIEKKKPSLYTIMFPLSSYEVLLYILGGVILPKGEVILK